MRLIILLMRIKEESEKGGLKLNIQKTKIMASSPITSWQIDGETMETVTDFILLGSKITVDGDSSHEIKRRLFLGKKAMTNLGSILKKKQRHYSANKGPYSQERKKRKKGKSLGRVQLFATPWIIAYQAPLSLGFSRQEYWSGLPLGLSYGFSCSHVWM